MFFFVVDVVVVLVVGVVVNVECVCRVRNSDHVVFVKNRFSCRFIDWSSNERNNYGIIAKPHVPSHKTNYLCYTSHKKSTEKFGGSMGITSSHWEKNAARENSFLASLKTVSELGA